MEYIDNKTVKVSYMTPKKVLTANPEEHNGYFEFNLKTIPYTITKRDCVNNLRPNLRQQAREGRGYENLTVADVEIEGGGLKISI